MQSKLTIVMYHYVRDIKKSRYPEIKGLDIRVFRNQIEYLRKYYQIITTEEVVHCIESGDKLPPKALLLTFDDGYIDHFTNVFPILSNYKLQGSFYIPVKAITENVVLDVNKIHFILASGVSTIAIVRDIKKLLSKYRSDHQLQSFDYYYNKLAKESRYDNKDVIFIKRLLQVELHEKLRLKIVDELFLKYVGIEEHIFARELYMNEQQIVHMRNSGMHIGSHGFNHYWWNHLNKTELEFEIDQSVTFLEKIGADMGSWTACYPYGSFDEQAAKMLAVKGCKMAVTTQIAIAEICKGNRFYLPRLDTNDLPHNPKSLPNNWFEKAR